jgi:hypothetical protein
MTGIIVCCSGFGFACAVAFGLRGAGVGVGCVLGGRRRGASAAGARAGAAAPSAPLEWLRRTLKARIIDRALRCSPQHASTSSRRRYARAPRLQIALNGAPMPGPCSAWRSRGARSGRGGGSPASCACTCSGTLGHRRDAGTGHLERVAAPFPSVKMDVMKAASWQSLTEGSGNWRSPNGGGEEYKREHGARL